MAFFENAKKNYKQVSQTALKKTKDLSEVVKLNTSIISNEDKIRELYHKLGYEVYRAYKANEVPKDKPLLDELDALYAQINEENERINKINAANKCPNCGAKVGKKDIFCGSCGTKLPEQKPIIPVCKACGATLLEGAMFCQSCGTKVE